MKSYFKIKKIFFFIALFFINGCTTFYVPTSTVEYIFDKGLRKSEQWLKTKQKFDKYNEDEFFYDDKGNIIKIISKDYYQGAGSNNKGKIIVYETTYKLINDYLVPQTFKCNDELVCQIDYEELKILHKGDIDLDIKSRLYIKEVVNLFNITIYKWTLDLDKMWGPFMVDDRFIKKDGNGNKYPTLGYDNIVIKRYFYSYYSLIKGLNKTYKGDFWYSPDVEILTNPFFKNSKFNLNYEWKTIYNKPCLTLIKFNAKWFNNETEAEVIIKYNNKGFRTMEEWNAFSNNKKITVFRQILEY